MRIYAYVTSETCRYMQAVLPDDEIGDKPVSKHGDYSPWYHGQRETVRMANGDAKTVYLIRAAKAVARAKGWK